MSILHYIKHLIGNCIEMLLSERIMQKGDFKSQLPVDRLFLPVPGSCHCSEQKKLFRTGWNHQINQLLDFEVVP